MCRNLAQPWGSSPLCVHKQPYDITIHRTGFGWFAGVGGRCWNRAMAASSIESEQPDPQVGLLAAVRASKQAETAEQIRQLRLVVEYLSAHEVDPDESATHLNFGQDTGLALAGEGAPCVSEFAVVELAAALGMTADAARAYAGKVLEVRYRLPGFWAKVTSGELAWWRAARVAEHTLNLPMGGARFVDAKLAWCAPRTPGPRSSGSARKPWPDTPPMPRRRSGRRPRTAAGWTSTWTGPAPPGRWSPTPPWTPRTPSIWRPRSPRVPPTSRPPAAPSHSTYAGRWRSGSWPAASSDSTSTPAAARAGR